MLYWILILPFWNFYFSYWSESVNGYFLEKNDLIYEIKDCKEFYFQVDNHKSKCFGYEYWEEDEDVGVKSIALNGDFAYLVDTYHTNIKRINLHNGSISSSTPLRQVPASKSGVWLRDITIFNDKVYVTSDRGQIYLFDLDLKVVDSIRTKFGVTTIFQKTLDSLVIYLGEEQLPDKSIEYDLLVIEKENKISSLKKRVSLSDYKSQGSDVFGKKYEQYTEGGKNFLKTEYGVFHLRSAIQPITEYSARNIDFTSNKIAYFYMIPSKITINICSY